ncbi:SpaA isopeptide-forming pilin-related protein [Faecalimonas sp.]
MKKMKRILSAALALILTLVLVTPAFAAGQDTNKSGTITINNAEPGKTYKAYRLFDLSYDGKGHYGYTVNEAWVKFFTEDAEGKALVNIDETNGNVTLKDNTEQGMQNLASKAKSYAETNTIPAVKEYTTQANEKKVTFANLPLGYYMTTTNAGGLYALDTTNPNTEMFEKNTKPTINKSADKTNAAYGEIVNYEIPFTIGGYIWGDYIITDIMTGLDMTDEQVKNVKISLNNQNISESYTVKYDKNSPKAGANTLKVTIPAETLKKYTSGTKLVLKYAAVAKKTVSMDNKVSMEYNNGPNKTEKTPEYEVKVANYEFVVKKTDEDDKVLDGAVFGLYTDAACTEQNRMKFIKTENKYRLAEKNENGVADIVAGQVTIEGLAAGTYYLKEISAPDGYNKLIKPVKIVITENRNAEGTSAFDNLGNRIDPTITMNDGQINKVGNEFILKIINKTGTELPSTGGIGTTIFYAVGSVLILAAVIVLMIKKRKEH